MSLSQAPKLLHLIKQFSSLITSSTSFYSSYHPSPICRSTKLYYKWTTKPHLHLHPSSIRNRFPIFTPRANATSYSRTKLFLKTTLGVSIAIGFIGVSPSLAYSMDGQDILVDFSGGEDEEENEDGVNGGGVVWMFVRKLWLPVFFLITVMVNLDQPIIMLVTKVLLFLITTKPSPLSVYVFVERLCHQCMHQQPHLYFFKSLYAKKVEVQDYKLLCLATIEVRDQKLTLVGILGGWWALPLSQGAFSVFRASALY